MGESFAERFRDVEAAGRTAGKKVFTNLKKHFGEECNKGLTDYLWCNSVYK